jgi:L-threonylcarbamoyladenylate synthase
MNARDAANLLAAGELVAFPTETVYGLGADATNGVAVRRIFELKGRPADHPLIVHVPDLAGLAQWGEDLPDAAMQLAESFWPGPLTLIVKKAARIASIVTGGQDSVGLRCPSHPVAQELLREFARIGSGAIAAKEGKQLQGVIDEALRDFVDKRKRGKPRPEILTAFGESLAEYDTLYRKLAK